MKHKVGDKVRIKSIGWYNRNKDEKGECLVKSECCEDGLTFSIGMSKFCGKEATIIECDEYDGTYKTSLNEDFWFNDGMFEDIPSNEILQKIADIIRESNIGLSVKEEDGNIIIKPLREKENELPVDTPVMVSDNKIDWVLRFYSHKNKVFSNGLKSKDKPMIGSWRCIIPFSRFDPENIEESLKYNIVKQEQE